MLSHEQVVASRLALEDEAKQAAERVGSLAAVLEAARRAQVEAQVRLAALRELEKLSEQSEPAETPAPEQLPAPAK